MRRWNLVVLLTVIVFVTACSAQAAEFPSGVFTREFFSSLGPETITLDLSEGRFATRSSAFGLLAEGSYTVDGDQVIFNEEQLTEAGRSFCGDRTVFQYRWEFDGQERKLHFFPTNDPCMRRGLEYTGGPWKPKRSSMEAVQY